MKAETRRLEKIYRRTQSAEDCRNWQEHFDAQRTVFQRVCTEYRKTIIDSSADSKSLWRRLNSLLKPNEVSVCPHKAEAFADFFDDKVNKIRATTTHSGPPVITTRLVHPVANFASCSGGEVIGFIKRAPNKHCELDPAPTWIVKECGDLLAPVLSTMINRTFESGIFPDEMQHAVLKPILKKAGLNAMNLTS